MLFALILAGGTGTRLWPRSRTRHPKQFLDLTGDLTMLQEAQARIAPIIPLDQILVATNTNYTDLVKAQLPDLPPANILGEPEGRGTAAAIGLAAIHIRRRDPTAVMAVLTADHLIARKGVFRKALLVAADLAADGWLVTLGIEPSGPETGYGYIERGESLAAGNGSDGYRVARFVEKPNLETAKAYIESERYSWNSGMFVWQASRILEEISQHMPALYDGLTEIEKSFGSANEAQKFNQAWLKLPNQTIDYGVMEKAQQVAVIPADIGWNDVGGWAAVYDVLPHDSAANAVIGQHVTPDTKGSLIISPKRLVATIGLENMVVIDTDDALLICPRDRAQEVKQIVGLLKAQGADSYLDGQLPVEAEPLTGSEVRQLFASGDLATAALLSLLFHTGLTPEQVAQLELPQVDLTHGWLVVDKGWWPMPQRTADAINDWSHANHNNSTRLFPQWKDATAIEVKLNELGEKSGLALTRKVIRATVARTLFDSSEEGRLIRSVLGDEAGQARLPLETLFPFSIGQFEETDENRLTRRAREALERVADLL